MSKFVPLHIRSGYSFLTSGLTIEKISESISKLDYIGAGITDENVMYGVPMFANALKAMNKPYIVGLQVQSVNQNISIYAINEEGYHLLCKISSDIQKNSFDLANLTKEHTGLVGVLSTNTEAFKTIFNDNDFPHILLDISKCFDDFYLGIEITSKEENQFAKLVRAFAESHTYKCIAFPEIKYQNKEDAVVIDIVKAIKEDQKIESREASGQAYFMKEEDYHKIYNQYEIENTEKLLKSSTFVFEEKRGELLHYPVDNSKLFLKELVYQRLKQKQLDNKQEYLERINEEINVICEMGYADYFLIVQDYVSYAKANDILVGPGRGSAAGSLVSYLLGITEIDPLKYNLQFERFLNKARKTMPDIDIDFMDTKRDEMVEYMRQKYGQNRVANIITFPAILAKQSLRDIGRIYNYPTRHIDLLSKAITDPKMSLRDAYKKLKAFRDLVDSDKYFLEIVKLASKIEGLPRQSGLHAAGIVLNNKPIEESMPISVDFDGNYITQYEMHYLEEQGFLKMDFLALRNLTIIDYTLKLIEHTKGKVIKYDEIPYEDENIFKLISSGQTMGLFQLESAGMKLAISKIKPTTFEDVVLLISIFRPGPMNNINDYVARKNGQTPITYLSKEVESVLKETCGILVYQEQVNKIAQVAAGFSLSEADVFRRAVSKKKKDVLESQRDKFISGMIKNHYTGEQAEALFSDIARFADYGFNKSHAVGYAMIASRMGYLKYYYPLEFYSAILQISSGANDTKFNEYVIELKNRNYVVHVPNINKSGRIFNIVEDGLLFPLSSIKGVNSLLVDKILEDRNENGPYEDFFDFVLRMKPYKITEKQIHALVNSGAFDDFNHTRAELNVATLAALQYAELNYSENGQMVLSPNLMSKPIIQENEDDPIQKLLLEHEAIGIMLSDSILRYKREQIEKANAQTIVEIDNELSEQISENEDENSYYYKHQKTFIPAKIAGMIISKKIISVKKNNNQMCFIKVIDETGEVEATLFPRVFEESLQFIDVNKIVVLEGKYEVRDDKRGFVVDKIELLEE